MKTKNPATPIAADATVTVATASSNSAVASSNQAVASPTTLAASSTTSAASSTASVATFAEGAAASTGSAAPAANVDIKAPAAGGGSWFSSWFVGKAPATTEVKLADPAAANPTGDITGGYQEVATSSTGIVTKDADSTAQSTATNFKDIFKTPEAQFVNGMLVSKATIAPTLNYLSAKLKGENTAKSFTDYYKEGVQASVSNVAKAALFVTTSVYNPMPAKYGITSKMAVNKLASDLIVNIVKLEFKELSNMFSINYAKDFGLFLASTGFSATGGKFLNIDKIFMENPFSMGAIMGSGAEIIDFVGSLVGFAGSLAGSSFPSPCEMMCSHNSTEV